MKESIEMEWKVNTPGFLREIMNFNDVAGILFVPMRIFQNLLYQVATEAARINDPELNKLMCKLALYEISDPYNKNYDEEAVKQVMSRLTKGNEENEKVNTVN